MLVGDGGLPVLTIKRDRARMRPAIVVPLSWADVA